MVLIGWTAFLIREPLTADWLCAHTRSSTPPPHQNLAALVGRTCASGRSSYDITRSRSAGTQLIFYWLAPRQLLGSATTWSHGFTCRASLRFRGTFRKKTKKTQSKKNKTKIELACFASWSYH